ncbi:DUF2235 domain-containing protein, partial [bacterium]
ICIDGTDDFAAMRPTHVFRLFRALERSDDQVVYYDGGVGTLGDDRALTNLKRKVLRKLDAAAATTLHRGFEEAYRFLVRNYKEGDQIFVFGFSRGAYTARALAGVVKLIGILHPSHENLIPFVWQVYSTFGEGEGSKEDSAFDMTDRLEAAFSQPAKIRFLGAWDTVSSVGLIKLRTLPFTSNLQSVERVMHAVSIDERRNMFPENLIQTVGKDGPKPEHLECWFAGVHRDVGGGGGEDARGLSMFPFHWIVEGAEASGLKINPRKRKKMEEIAADACGKDNGNPLFVWVFAVLGLIPMKWWDQTKRKFAWKWLNFVHRRPIPAGGLRKQPS